MERIHARQYYRGTATERELLTLPVDSDGALFFELNTGTVWYWDRTEWQKFSTPDSAAPISASYLTVEAEAGLPGSRHVYVPDDNLLKTADGGVGEAYTLAVDAEKLEWLSGKLAIGVLAGKTLTLATVNDVTVTFPLTAAQTGSVTSSSDVRAGGAALLAGDTNGALQLRGLRLGVSTIATAMASLLEVYHSTTSSLIYDGDTLRLAANGPLSVQQSRHSNDVTSAQVLLRKSRGTGATPAAVQSGDTLALFSGAGYYDNGAGGVGFGLASAQIQFIAEENFSGSSNLGTSIRFRTTTVGGSASAFRVAIYHNGSMGLGITVPSALLHVQGTTEQLRLGYNASNYARFTVDAAGALTIAATGDLKLTSAASQKIGLWGVPPVAQPVLAAYTSDSEAVAYTGIDNAQAGSVYAQLTDLNQLRAAYETLRVAYDDLRTKLLTTGIAA